MVRVYYDLLAADNLLLFGPIHQMVLMESIFLSLIVTLLLMLLLPTGTAREHRASVKVVVALRLLGFRGARELAALRHADLLLAHVLVVAVLGV